MRYKNAFILLKQAFSALLVILLLFSCSERQGLKSSEFIVGKWNLINLDDLNTLQKAHYEKMVFDHSIKPYDPTIRISYTYFVDGTGYWEVQYERKAKSQRNFIYKFAFPHEYQLVVESDNTTYKHKILNIEENRFTEILVGTIIDGEEEENFEELFRPIPLTFERDLN